MTATASPPSARPVPADADRRTALVGGVRILATYLTSITAKVFFHAGRPMSTPSPSSVVPSPVRSGSRSDAVLPVHRLHLMRAAYLFMGVGLALVKWPLLVEGAHTLPLFEGVVACLLTAMSVLAFLGLRHPVRMLPVLLFESAWKLLWLGAVAVPRAVSGDLDAATTEVIVNCSLVVVVLVAVPWRFAWRQYVAAPGDPWR